MDISMIVVTIVSLIVAATMSVVASQMVREERRRSEARVAALAADINGSEPMSSTSVASDGRRQDLPLHADDALSATALFAPPPSMPARASLAVVVVLGALVLGAGAALAVVFAGAGSGGSVAADASQAGRARATSTAPGPLELVALGHERDGDGLTIRGVLRNPASGAELHQLTAVVLLFGHDGTLVGSGRAPVHTGTLGPGNETTFEVSIPSAAGVDRYRVSFRSDEHVVPHIDLRS